MWIYVMCTLFILLMIALAIVGIKDDKERDEVKSYKQMHIS